MIMPGLRRYEAVVHEVETASGGSVRMQSPRLMRALALAIQITLAVVIAVFLLGWPGHGDTGDLRECIDRVSVLGIEELDAAGQN